MSQAHDLTNNLQVLMSHFRLLPEEQKLAFRQRLQGKSMGDMHWELCKFLAEVCPPQTCNFDGCIRRVYGRPSFCYRHIDIGFRLEFSALLTSQTRTTWNIFATVLQERLTVATPCRFSPSEDDALLRECVELYRSFKAPHFPDFIPTPDQLRVILETFKEHQDDDDIRNEVNRLTGKPMQVYEV